MDESNLAEFDFGDIPRERDIMTTWHADEPLGEAFWFATHSATHPDVELARTIIVHVATAPREAELLAAYRAAAEA